MTGRNRRMMILLSVAFGIFPSLWLDEAISASQQVLAEPASMLVSAERIDFVGSNALAVENSPFGQCLRSTPKRSATALYQRVTLPAQALERVRWSWRIDMLQHSADVRDLAHEDFGAKIMFVFGEPSVFKKDVPTLAYVWTTTPVANGSVLPSLRYSSLFYVQLRGAGDVGRWQQETRSILEDYRSVFGREPGPLRYIAVFNDNDQTSEATSALFGPIVSAP